MKIEIESNESKELLRRLMHSSKLASLNHGTRLELKKQMSGVGVDVHSSHRPARVEGQSRRPIRKTPRTIRELP